MAEITAEELLARYAAGERDFQGVILSGIVWGRAGGARVNLEGANFTRAIFKQILCEPYPTTNVTIGGEFINCNFSYSEWEFCDMPSMRGCSLQYAVMKGCFFSTKFVDCDFRASQMIGRYFDRGILVFERCDLTGLITSDGPTVGPSNYVRWIPSPDDIYLNTIDPDGVFRSGVCSSWPRFDPDPEQIPF
jgi:hypothetical protein